MDQLHGWPDWCERYQVLQSDTFGLYTTVAALWRATWNAELIKRAPGKERASMARSGRQYRAVTTDWTRV